MCFEIFWVRKLRRPEPPDIFGNFKKSSHKTKNKTEQNNGVRVTMLSREDTEGWWGYLKSGSSHHPWPGACVLYGGVSLGVVYHQYEQLY